MTRIRSLIAPFVSAILVTGLLLSTLHLHEVMEISGPDLPDTGLKFEMSHHFCPFCSVLFEGTIAVQDGETAAEKPAERVPSLHQRVDNPFSFAATSGRSPPLG